VARYRIIPERSKIWIEARSSLHPIKAESSAMEGNFEMEMADGRVDLQSAPKGWLDLEVESLKTGNRLYDRQIEGELEVRKYPRIHGEVREVSAGTDGDRLRVRGDLSLHGVTRRLEGDVVLAALDADTMQVEGEKTIDLREFNLKPPQILMLKVYPEVKIRARIVARREG